MRQLRSLHLDLEGKILWEGGRGHCKFDTGCLGDDDFVLNTLGAYSDNGQCQNSVMFVLFRVHTRIGCKNTYIYISFFFVYEFASRSSLPRTRSYMLRFVKPLTTYPLFENCLKWMCPRCFREYFLWPKDALPRKLHPWLSKEGVRVMRFNCIY